MHQFGENGITDTQRSSSAVTLQGIAIIFFGLILLALVHTSSLQLIGSYLPGTGLIIVAWFMVRKRKEGMFKLGRLTAVIVIIAVGVLLLLDQIRERNHIGVLVHWWPAAFVMLGIEVVIYSLSKRSKDTKIAVDIGGSFIAAVIAIAAFGVTQYATVPLSWLDEFKVNFAGVSGFGEEKGYMYAKEALHVLIGPDTKTISIDNPNGNVSVKKGDVNEVTIQTMMWVDVPDKQEADAIAEQSKVVLSEGAKLSIQANGQSYRGAKGNLKPRMNMVITIPSSSVFALPIVKEEEPPADAANSITYTTAAIPSKINIQATNGSVDIDGLVLPGGLNVKITSGQAKLSSLYGSVNVQTKNGDINATAIEGHVQMTTYNGSVTARQITGGFEGSTSSGNIQLQHISGHIEADAKNGEITIKEASSSIKADTLNGDIEIQSAIVGGNWDIDSSIGEIRLYVPREGSFSVNGSVTFGTVSSELPLILTKKTISGGIGSGDYRIDIDANSSIEVNFYRP